MDVVRIQRVISSESNSFELGRQEWARIKLVPTAGDIRTVGGEIGHYVPIRYLGNGEFQATDWATE